MPTKPQILTLTNSSVDVLNVIRNNATQNYQNYVPVATPDANSIREIGAVIMDNTALQNEFLSALANRIGRVILTAKMYSNPWSAFKKGLLEYGESIEEIFVNLAKPFQFDPAVAETEVFKREIPDVRAAFHIMNYQKFYKSTIQNDQLRQAFLSWQGITDLIAKIIDSLYTGANYDEFLTMKYMLAKRIINGQMNVYSTAGKTIHETVAEIKAVSNKFEFMSTNNNLAGVSTFSPKSDQYLITTADFDANMDVNVLASAFNMDKAEFLGHRVTVDDFGTLDIARLNLLFENDSTYTEFSEDELATLKSVQAVLVDKDFFMIFDNFQKFNEIYNSQGLYWNYVYHAWKTFSISPFTNNALFTSGEEQAVTNVTVSPSTATVSAGQSVNLTASVTTSGFASQAVNWSITSGVGATVSTSGSVQIASTATAGAKITVTATSVFDHTKTGTATITVA